MTHLTDIKIEGEIYKFEDVLGNGAYGCVRKAYEASTRKHFAIKVIDHNQLPRGHKRNFTKNEIDVHKGLDHPNILKLWAAVKKDNYTYLLLDLCSTDLEKFRREKGGKLSENEAAHIFQEIVAGMLYLKSRNIIHRDLKLQNILLKDKTVKIADFGFADFDSGNHNSVCGTPTTMAPEVERGQHYTHKADLYSLGCILYTLLVGLDVKKTSHSATQDFDSLSPDAKDLIQSLRKVDARKRIELEDVRKHPFLRNNCLSPGYNSKASRFSDSGYVDSACSGALGRNVRPISLQSSDRPSRPTFRNEPYVVMDKGRQRVSGSTGNQNIKSRVNLPVPCRVNYGMDFVKSDPKFQRRGINGYSPHRSGEDQRSREQYNTSPHGSCHGNSVEKNSCCSQCTETYNCQREKCHERRLRCLNFGRAAGTCRTCSPSRFCHGCEVVVSNHKQHSHPGGYNATHLTYGDINSNRNMNVNGPGQLRSIEEKPARSQPAPVKPEKLDTQRLKPLRLISKTAAISITENGDIICEALRPRKDVMRIVEVYQISGDGSKMTVYKPPNKVIVHPENSCPIPEEIFAGSFDFDDLPVKYWLKYAYSAKFICDLKAKTPKVTIYSHQAKCVLMESRQDFVATFYDGTRFTKSPASIEVIEPDGRKTIIENNVDNLGKKLHDMLEHLFEMEAHCHHRECSESRAEKSFFPLILGRRPFSKNDKTKVALLQSITPSTITPSLASYNGSKMTLSSSTSSTAASQKENIMPLGIRHPLSSKQPNSYSLRSSNDERFTMPDYDMSQYQPGQAKMFKVENGNKVRYMDGTRILENDESKLKKDGIWAPRPFSKNDKTKVAVLQSMTPSMINPSLANYNHSKTLSSLKSSTAESQKEYIMPLGNRHPLSSKQPNSYSLRSSNDERFTMSDYDMSQYQPEKVKMFEVGNGIEVHFMDGTRIRFLDNGESKMKKDGIWAPIDKRDKSIVGKLKIAKELVANQQ